MAANHGRQAIPTKLSEAQFGQFVLPHLSRGRRGPPPTLPLQRMFNYVLKALYMGCQWKMLPIETDAKGLPEIHHTRIYRIMRRWQADGSIDRVFAGSVDQLHRDQLLDLANIHGDGTTTAAKKGGDNLGYSGHKHLKGDKVVAFCDRNCNIIAPFVTAPGNRNESPLLRDALPKLTAMRAPLVRTCRLNRQSGWRLRLPRKPPCDLQPRYEAQHSREPAWAQGTEARSQTAFRRGHLRGALQHHRARVRLGGHLPPPAAALRTHQCRALRAQDARLHDDQPEALLPQLIAALRAACRYFAGALRHGRARRYHVDHFANQTSASRCLSCQLMHFMKHMHY